MSHHTIDLATLLHRGGHRLTPQRRIILDTLCEMGGHVTATELYERVHGRHPAIDRSTVYRALAFFSEIDLVRASDAGGATLYEIDAGESGRDHHHHLICRHCGRVDHISGDAFNEFAARLRDEFGFAADADNLTIQGVCRECREKGEVRREK